MKKKGKEKHEVKTNKKLKIQLPKILFSAHLFLQFTNDYSTSVIYSEKENTDKLCQIYLWIFTHI